MYRGKAVPALHGPCQALLVDGPAPSNTAVGVPVQALSYTLAVVVVSPLQYRNGYV